MVQKYNHIEITLEPPMWKKMSLDVNLLKSWQGSVAKNIPVPITQCKVEFNWVKQTSLFLIPLSK